MPTDIYFGNRTCNHEHVFGYTKYTAYGSTSGPAEKITDFNDTLFSKDGEKLVILGTDDIILRFFLVGRCNVDKKSAHTMNLVVRLECTKNSHADDICQALGYSL
jgi:hypothetical protein